MDDEATEPEQQPPRPLADAVELALRAFALAKASGRDDWRTMTLAVFKNRLLDLTGREFHESQWGASDVRSFVELLAPTVQLSVGDGPPRAVLVDDVDVDGREAVAVADSVRRTGDWSVRQDLWDAVIDYRSGRAYGWWEGVAQPFEAEEPLPADMPLLPTVDREQVVEWRRSFAATQAVPDDQELARDFAVWASGDGSSRRLPPRLRNPWFGVLKRHVRARLEEWFADRGVEPPADFVVYEPKQADGSPGDVEQLRDVAIRAVRAMTAAELRTLSLPASVLARLLR